MVCTATTASAPTVPLLEDARAIQTAAKATNAQAITAPPAQQATAQAVRNAAPGTTVARISSALNTPNFLFSIISRMSIDYINKFA